MLLAEIATYLAAQGIGTAGTDLFYGSMKEFYPDAVTVLYEYGGLMDEVNMGDSTPSSSTNKGRAIRLEYPRIQVVCRGAKNDYTTPRAKAESARTALIKIINQTLSGVRYLAIEPLQPPFRIRTDENFREYIGFNCQVTKELS